MWDVGVERQVSLKGPDALEIARQLAGRNLDGLTIGQGKYAPLCDFNGRLINDPVLLQVAEDEIWLSIADSDISLWATAFAGACAMDVQVTELDVSPLAVQGPKAQLVLADLFGEWIHDLRYFGFRQTMLGSIPVVVARSGWSKQGGYEIYLMDSASGTLLWDRVKEAGAPYGIGPGTPNYIERVESGLIPGRMSRGDWKAGTFIDERADERAYEGLAQIFKGEAGGTTRLFSMLISEDLGVESAPVKFERNEDERLLTVEKKIVGGVSPIQGTDASKEVTVNNTGYWMGPDITVAQATKGRVRAFGRVWDFEGRSAEICQINWNAPH